MFDDDQELGPVLALVIGIAIAVSLFAIAVALSVARLSAGDPGDGAVRTDADHAAPAETGVTRLYFPLGSHVLQQDAGGSLFTIAVAATVDPTRRIEVSGYHDASGDPGQNVELARARALTVRDALVAAGVARDRIDLRKPIAATGNDDPQQARRVDVRLH